MSAEKPRCAWAGDDPLMRAYHDTEWGKPLRDDRALYEMLMLEGAQAGLSWSTILKKRENYRRAFDGFEPAKIARYTPARMAKLMQDEGIVRNRAKIEAFVLGARAWLEIQKGQGFSKYIWSFVDNRPIVNRLRAKDRPPAETELSQLMSKDLKARGFKFVGPTIVYAFMQAVGIVNDHAVTCFRHPDFKPSLE